MLTRCPLAILLTHQYQSHRMYINKSDAIVSGSVQQSKQSRQSLATCNKQSQSDNHWPDATIKAELTMTGMMQASMQT